MNLDEEALVLILTLADAFDAAARGRRARGYALLLRGHQEAMAAHRAAKPWAGEMLARYREAMRRYPEEYGLPFEPEPSERELARR